MTDDQLARYAELVLHSGVGFRDGEALFVHAEPAHGPLAIALAEAAYRMGAASVDLDYDDPLLRRARIRFARDGALGATPAWKKQRLRRQVASDAAVVDVAGEAYPGLLRDLDAERVVADHARPARELRWYDRAALDYRLRWVVCAWPTPAWAAQVYPDQDEATAVRRLTADLLGFCRTGDDDPPGA